ncbi:MAG: recombination protein RecR, partial [Dehalococcoidia bacterium]|nr:recombination protein RecR [Dehalococcoidia bacterium]
MALTAEPIARLVQSLSKLPGIGPKSAQRLVYHL